jgi:FKBP-type peptidyl-prolyl cis-trans isomerase 2
MLTSAGIRLDVQIPPEEPERSFGNYQPGRYAWVLANILQLDEPIPARGYQSLWVPDDELKGRIEAVVPGVAA